MSRGISRIGEQKPTAHRVDPSARDPIGQWLDVLMSMLSLPREQRRRIRAELEDHLRSRVDDLMIVGTCEREAIEQAVKELGETAELAERFTRASAPGRRSLMMNTLLISAAGLGLAFGTTSLLAPSAPPAGSNPLGAETTPPVAAELRLGDDTLTESLPALSLYEALEIFSQQLRANRFVHWGTLAAGEGDDLPALPVEGLSLGRALELANSSLDLEGPDAIEFRRDGKLLEFASRAYFDRMETVTLDHDISAIAPSSAVLGLTPEAVSLREHITTVVEPGLWDEDSFAVSCIGTTLTVRAPKRVQAEVVVILDRLIAQQAEQHAAAAERGDRMQAFALRERAKSLQAQKQLIDELRVDIEHISHEMEEVSRRYWESMYAAQDVELAHADLPEGDERDAMLQRLVQMKAESEALDLRRQALTRRYHAQRDRIEQTEMLLADAQRRMSQGSAPQGGAEPEATGTGGGRSVRGGRGR